MLVFLIFSWSDDNNHSLSITVNGVTRNQVTDNTFDFFDLGYFETESMVTIKLSFPGNKVISFDNPSFYALILKLSDSYEYY